MAYESGMILQVGTQFQVERLFHTPEIFTYHLKKWMSWETISNPAWELGQKSGLFFPSKWLSSNWVKSSTYTPEI